MTVVEALAAVQRVGDVSVREGNLRLRLPRSAREMLEPAIEVLRREKAAAMLALEPTPSGAAYLKGRAVELWRTGDRFFLVADDDDRQVLIERGVGMPGEVWTPHELELIARLPDQETRDSVDHTKRVIGGRIRCVVTCRVAGPCQKCGAWTERTHLGGSDPMAMLCRLCCPCGVASETNG
jgi:hypothetical protein